MRSVTFGESTLVIKNSKFIGMVFPVHHEEDVKEYLSHIRSKYMDATHCCYAYIIDSIKKESDDGEPGGTAGIPMLQVLEKNHLNHVLCIVVRYFGKIKLGAGGLVRAYTKSVTTTLENHMVDMVKGYLVKITFSYDYSKNIDLFLKNHQIVQKEFLEQISYSVLLTDDDLKMIRNQYPYVKILIMEDAYF